MAELRRLLLTACAVFLLLLALIAVCLLPPSHPLSISTLSAWLRPQADLDRILQETAMPDKTVIITTLNEAWATPNSMIDLFLHSFGTGKKITRLVNHLLIVALDEKSYERCLSIHLHCFHLKKDGVDFSRSEKLFMTPDYLTMMWTRIDFLRQVLEKGFSFIFSDADVLWFRDPFEYLSPDADVLMACDHYVGDPWNLTNEANGGFVYARANTRTVNFYKYWFMAREAFPGMHDQDVFNMIKQGKALEEIGLQMQFFDTKYISCFCQPSDDLEKVVTMHANCCFGLESKLQDLRRILADWNRYQLATNRSEELRWSAPKSCLQSSKVLESSEMLH
ncbi:hypothetical protein GOP47_0025672 [Adiantum capillus-veneris]|uniref:Glycosyltransferase n=1 Tax=Adiantum capillus-veneris TaxID=13818 RepID=A0A9D4U0Y8_ADICA|nr:hypothetical protein GOP47_0025672 [Adiantum capillus-veneris]